MNKRKVSAGKNQRNGAEESEMYHVLSGKMLKKDVDRHAKAVGHEGREWLKWSLHPEDEIANRASWIFRTWADLHPEALNKIFPALYKTIGQSDNGSVIRNLTGVWVDHGYLPKHDSRILELGLALINTSHHAIATYANALGMMKYACGRYPELKEEVRLHALRHPLATEAGFQKRLQDVMKA